MRIESKRIEETKRKISETKKGKKRTEEKKKISEGMKRYWKNIPYENKEKNLNGC